MDWTAVGSVATAVGSLTTLVVAGVSAKTARDTGRSVRAQIEPVVRLEYLQLDEGEHRLLLTVVNTGAGAGRIASSRLAFDGFAVVGKLAQPVLAHGARDEIVFPLERGDGALAAAVAAQWCVAKLDIQDPYEAARRQSICVRLKFLHEVGGRREWRPAALDLPDIAAVGAALESGR